MAVVQLQARRFELPHELMIVGGNDDRRAKPVEFDEQTQETPRHLWVDVASRLVGEQEFRLAYDRARDRRTLLFSARQDRRIAVHAITQAHPLQKIGHILFVIRNLLARYPERQRNVLPGG